MHDLDFFEEEHWLGKGTGCGLFDGGLSNGRGVGFGLDFGYNGGGGAFQPENLTGGSGYGEHVGGLSLSSK